MLVVDSGPEAGLERGYKPQSVSEMLMCRLGLE